MKIKGTAVNMPGEVPCHGFRHPESYLVSCHCHVTFLSVIVTLIFMGSREWKSGEGMMILRTGKAKTMAVSCARRR